MIVKAGVRDWVKYTQSGDIGGVVEGRYKYADVKSTPNNYASAGALLRFVRSLWLQAVAPVPLSVGYKMLHYGVVLFSSVLYSHRIVPPFLRLCQIRRRWVQGYGS